MSTLKTPFLISLVTTTFLILLIVVDTLSASLQQHEKTQLTVGYLPAVKGVLKDKQGLSISGAILLALEEINNDTTILPNVHLNLRWNDTRGDTVVSTRAITEMICDGVSTIFGPEGTCHTEAIVTQSRNIPMMSYVSCCQLFSNNQTRQYTIIHPIPLLIFAEMFRLQSFSNSNIRQN